ncbi:GGDEF domain-containing protein [Shewanella sairae]|uniref:GGDEF domain-containing protein n=1 Tax=Shewanella sairae TaxID=190310 RepID=A0ABQ4P077_9GAMM|nr:GGDEF domain-containing protein [Shewanella sairae]MCL1131804.1 GGDEF domain-containing protein [Shewanella sairae]GIU40837.1 GGDEF domain-containing protein [Shewanella sairae]
MLAQDNNQTVWLREKDHPAINLPRWQQQVDLINDLYQAKNTLIIQTNGEEAQTVCSAPFDSKNLMLDEIFEAKGLIQSMTEKADFGVIHLTPAEIGCATSAAERLLAIQLSWPDGRVFGCLLICDPAAENMTNTHAAVCGSVKALIQGEFKQMYMMEQLQRLSVQDEFTYMLNPYGFNLMAPRQLSLSRRFGSHAGLIVLEAMPSRANASTVIGSQFIRTIARVISESMREADICARFDDKQFIILAFIDSESNLDTLIARLRKRLVRETPEIDLVSGMCFFSPDSQQSLMPMQQEAIADLEKNRAQILARRR